MPLRSNFEPGTSRWATRRAQWRALGLTDEDMVKPKIAIVNSSSQLAICFSHLDEIARRARRAVELAGGVAFEVRTAAPSDFITSAGHRGGYILSARDLITNDIEVAVEGALLDGMLCLASCDKTAPGQLMAAARLNIPSVIVACGYQPSGTYRASTATSRTCSWPPGTSPTAGSRWRADRDERARRARAGRVRGHGHGQHHAPGLRGARHGAARHDPGPGQQRADVAGGRAGRAPRGRDDRRGTAAAGHPDQGRLRQRGDDRPVSQRLDQLGQALQAVAAEAECGADVYRMFEELADRVPLLAAVRPNGEVPIEAFEDAGGARAVMKQLEPLLHTEAHDRHRPDRAARTWPASPSPTPRSSARRSGPWGTGRRSC